MKQTILYFIAGLFFLIGCTQEEPSLTESNQVGYLTVEDLTLQQAEQISVRRGFVCGNNRFYQDHNL